jgi:predicted nuclease of predicted toxin-antitoxin system
MTLLKTLLFDENFNQKMAKHFRAHGFTVTLPQTVGFKALRNGELLAAAEGRFDVLVTQDKDFPYQHNMRGRKLAVLIFRIKVDSLRNLLMHLPAAIEILHAIEPGTIRLVGEQALLAR